MRVVYENPMPSRVPPPVGACLLGSIRTYALPCVGELTMARVIAPLEPWLYAFVNVPAESSPQTLEAAQVAVFRHADAYEVVVHTIAVDNETANHRRGGYAQAAGLRACWDAAGRLARHAWLVRVRTDAYHAFRTPAAFRLPPAPADGASTVYAGVLGGRDCGHRWTDDRFWLLHGARAQRAALLTFATFLENVGRRPVTRRPSRREAPECLLGGAVEAAGVRAVDVRALVANATGGRRAMTLIVRRECAEIASAPWVTPVDGAPAELVLRSAR